jgi:peroxiredoxin
VQIVAVGFDPPGRNAAWAEEEGFPFEVWTDESRALALAYGAVSSASASFPARLTVILDADGNQLLEYQVTSVGTHPGQVLADCEVLFGR